MVGLIDTMHMGHDRVIGAWERDGVIVDPGPGSTAATVIAALEDEGAEIEAILLTHIHLDHAGAAGHLALRWPRAQIYVHELGAPHIADPSRLWASASRLYGAERMEEMWGEALPVPAERLTTLSGGEVVAGMEVLAAPGHASHHVVYLDRDEGSAYVGDVAGVRILPAEPIVMPTPPPEIDVEAWQRSLDALADRAPERLRLTHFGEAAEAGAQLEAAREALLWQAELARGGDRDRFLEALAARVSRQPEDAADRMVRAMPPEQAWLGLQRYWRKRSGAP